VVVVELPLQVWLFLEQLALAEVVQGMTQGVRITREDLELLTLEAVEEQVVDQTITARLEVVLAAMGL
jgi:hypothetical protein